MKRMLIAGCCVLASFCAVAQDGAPAGAAKKPESFANGALRAAQWVVAKSPGIYDMQDVLGLK